MRILVKPGFKLNPNEKIVKGIIKAIERNEGKCPCVHEESCDDPICPCSDYRLKDKCCCQLYIKEV
jgi:ferredoxin-thioredoxin reductase catalytic subunit